MQDSPMQRNCSELNEKLLKSLDKEYNVSKAECGVSRWDAPRRLRVRTRKRLSGHSRSPVRRVAACTSSVRECSVVCVSIYVCVCMCSSVAATTGAIVWVSPLPPPRLRPSSPSCGTVSSYVIPFLSTLITARDRDAIFVYYARAISRLRPFACSHTCSHGAECTCTEQERDSERERKG